MKVFVCGATGYIGHECMQAVFQPQIFESDPSCFRFRVALALVRAGHDVHGSTLELNRVKELEAEEITPVICDLLAPSEYRHVLPGMDVVIDAAGGADVEELGPTILQTTLEEAHKARPNGPPLSYIYCSGSWVHGNSKPEVLSDRSPVTNPIELTAWRAPFEQEILSSISKSFTANIIRPGMVYGGSSSYIGFMLFASAREGNITWYGDKHAMMPTVHNHDLAEAFRLCAEKSYSVPGVIFDISNVHSEPVSFILARLKAVSKARDITLKEPETALEIALACSSMIRPQLAKSLLGWEPKKPSLAEGMERYYMAWLASTIQHHHHAHT